MAKEGATGKVEKGKVERRRRRKRREGSEQHTLSEC